MMNTKGKLIILAISIILARASINSAFFMDASGLTLGQGRDSIVKCMNQLKLPETTWIVSNRKFTVFNFKAVSTLYGKGSENVTIDTHYKSANVTQGQILIYFQGEFSKKDLLTQKVTYGKFQAQVQSQPYMTKYNKYLVNQTNELYWKLDELNYDFSWKFLQQNIYFTQFYPYGPQKDVILQMLLSSISEIKPSPIFTQIVSYLKQNYASCLKQYLTPKKFKTGPYLYTYNDIFRGKMEMNTKINLVSSAFTQQGLKMLFNLQIDNNQHKSHCQNAIDMPLNHLDWNKTGNQQQVNHYCVFKDVVSFLYRKGWLDINLNNSWDQFGFSFNTDSLIGLIDNIQKKFNPKTPLKGFCSPISQDSVHVSRHPNSTYYNLLTCAYKCSFSAQSKQGKQLNILNFTLKAPLTFRFLQKQGILTVYVDSLSDETFEYEQSQQFVILNREQLSAQARIVVIRYNRIEALFGTDFPLLKGYLVTSFNTDNYLVLYQNYKRIIGQQTKAVKTQ